MEWAGGEDGPFSILNSVPVYTECGQMTIIEFHDLESQLEYV